jgi:hypothetical protein
MWYSQCYWNYYGKCSFDYFNYFCSAATQNQTGSGTAITSTVYTFGGSATDATVTNLPTGLTSVVAQLLKQ